MKKWSDGCDPEIMDGYYFSNLAVDVLQVGYRLYSLSNHHLNLVMYVGIIQKKKNVFGFMWLAIEV